MIESAYMKEKFQLMDAPRIARLLLDSLPKDSDRTTVVALKGDLGVGKTSLAQAIGHKLGITEPMASPTFVLMKRYIASGNPYTSLIHIEAYRIEDEVELLPIHFKELLDESRTLMVVEWPENIKGALSGKNIHYFQLSHLDGDERLIESL